MDISSLTACLTRINGSAFATIDSVTQPKPGVTKHTTGTQVLLFANIDGVSGYEKMVRSRLAEIGKDPDGFVLKDLPWGEKIPDSPLISRNGILYLQCIVIMPGTSDYFVGNFKVDPKKFGIREERGVNFKQGLPSDKQVNVACYRLENIKRIALLGEEFV